MAKPKLGLLVLNCNYSQFLNWALNSVLEQTKKPDILVFMDDNSQDNSVQIFNMKYEKSLPWTEIFLNQETLGTVKAANLGVEKLAELGADYICILSSDDVLHPDYLKKTYEALKKAPKDVGFVYTWVRRIGVENSFDKHPEFDGELIQITPYTHNTSLIKYEAWKDVEGLANVSKQEDWAMFRKMVHLGWKGQLLPEAIFYWRRHNRYPRTYFSDEGAKKRGEEWKHATKNLGTI